jgi:hypothetical protein
MPGQLQGFFVAGPVTAVTTSTMGELVRRTDG